MAQRVGRTGLERFSGVGQFADLHLGGALRYQLEKGTDMASTMQDYRTSRELPTLDEFRSANGPLMLGGILALIEREQSTINGVTKEIVFTFSLTYPLDANDEIAITGKFQEL